MYIRVHMGHGNLERRGTWGFADGVAVFLMWWIKSQFAVLR